MTRYSFPKLSVSTFLLFFVDIDDTELVFERESLWSRPLLFAGHFDIICCIKSHTFRPQIQPLPFPSNFYFVHNISQFNIFSVSAFCFFFWGGGGERGAGVGKEVGGGRKFKGDGKRKRLKRDCKLGDDKWEKWRKIQ